MIARRIRGSFASASVLLLLAVPAAADDASQQAAQPQPTDSIDAETLAETQQRALDIARELINEYAGVEREQQALLQKLSEADRQLAEEKARADRLEREMARLLGQPEAASPEAPTTIERPEPVGPPALTIPPREVNALGIVDDETTLLAEAPDAADALRLTPLRGTLPAGGSLQLVVNGREVRFEHHDPLSGATPLATLTLTEGRIEWRWSNASSATARPAIGLIPWALAGSTLEALAGGEVVGAWRFDPPTLRVATHAGRQVAPAPPFDDAVPLTLQPMAGQPGWIVTAHTPTTLRAQSPSAEVTIEWRPGENAVVATGQTGGDAITDLDRQIAAWEADLAKLRQKTPADAEAIERTAALIADLRQKQAALNAAAATPGAARAAYVVELVADAGVAVARYVIQP